MARVNFLCIILIKHVIQIQANNNFDKGNNLNFTRGAPGPFHSKVRKYFTLSEQKGPGLNDIAKIVGGENAGRGEWPWQVALLDENGKIFCGGSLISRKHVITTAHCVKSGSLSKVRLGEYDKTVKDIDEKDVSVVGYYAHPLYESTSFDIAIILLKDPVDFKYTITPVRMNENFDFTGQQCDITGWGSLNDNSVKPTTLQVTRLPIVKTEECQKFYDIKITESMLCAGYANRGIGACFGDSGGPLVCRNSDGLWYLTGITSRKNKDRCGAAYVVFTNVAYLYNWIYDIIQL